MSAAYVYDAVRVPFGRYGGALASVRPDDLGAVVVKSIVERNGVDPEQIDDVIFGNANGAGEDNRNVGHMATLLAGLPTSVPGSTINRLCGSSLDAAMPGEPRDRDRRRRRRARRRRGVDEPRAVGGAEAGEGLPGRSADDALHHARLAHGQPEHAGPVDDLARRVDREAGRHPRRRPGGAGRVRAAQPPARRPGLERRLLRLLGRPGAGRRPRARRGHPRGLVAGEAGQAQARVRQGATGRSRPATRHRSTTAPPPC